MNNDVATVAPSPSSPPSNPRTMVDDLGRLESGVHTRVVGSVTLDGRYKFPVEDPECAKGWTIAKWTSHMALSPFAPKNELEMETWFEKEASKIRACAPSLNTFVSVLMNEVDTLLQAVLGYCLDQNCPTLEDVGDVVAGELFGSSRAASEFEPYFFQSHRCGSVLEAQSTFHKASTTYGYLCRRVQRTTVLTSEVQADSFLRHCPECVEKKVKAKNKRLVEYGNTFNAAHEEERILKELNGGRLPPSTSPRPAFAADQSPRTSADDSNRRVPGPCFSCGGNHFRKDCPHRDERCSRCGYKGHLESACRNHVTKDASGRPRMVVKAGVGKIDASFKTDRTWKDRLESVEATVTGLKRSLERTSDREKSRRIQKAGDKRPVSKESANVAIETPEPVEIDSDNDEDITESYLAMPEEAISNCLRANATINGKLSSVILDSGASSNLMSAHIAKRMGLEVDPAISPVTFNGVGGQVPHIPCSHPVSLQLGSGPVVSTRFHLVPAKVPILICPQTMSDCRVEIDYSTKRALSDKRPVEVSFSTINQGVTEKDEVVQGIIRDALQE